MFFKTMLKKTGILLSFTLMTVANTTIALGEKTSGETAVSETSKKSLSKQETQKIFATRFAPLKERILDEKGFFSMSKMTKELSALFPLAKQIGKDSQELFDLYDMYTLVLSKKPEYSKDLIEHGNNFLNSFKDNALFTEEKQAWFHYRLTNAYQYIDDFPNGIKHQALFITLAEKNKLLSTESSVLGQKEQLAYLFHENKQYAEALNVNREIEKRAQKTDIPEDNYLNLYNNLAQNYYGLNQLSKARDYLNKRLALSIKYKQFYTELNTLFQLAVLSFEEKKFDESETLFKKRIKLVKNNKEALEDGMLEDMEEDLTIYYEKKKAKKQKWSL